MAVSHHYCHSCTHYFKDSILCICLMFVMIFMNLFSVIVVVAVVVVLEVVVVIAK